MSPKKTTTPQLTAPRPFAHRSSRSSVIGGGPKTEIIRLREGRALLMETTSKGGVRYEPAEVEDKDNTRLKASVQTFDDRGLERWVTKVRNGANNLVRRNAIHIDLGVWFVDKTAMAAIDKEMDKYRQEVYCINQDARNRGFQRETRCEYFLFGWDPNDQKLVIRMGQLIYSRLNELKEVYTDPNPERFRVEWDKCRQLPRLIEDPHSSLLDQALKNVDNGRKFNRFDPKGTSLLDKMILLFKPVADAFLVEYPTVLKK